MDGNTKLTLLMSATSLLRPIQVSHGFIPTAMVKRSEWSRFSGTIAGYWFEFRLLSESRNDLVVGVSFSGGILVRVILGFGGVFL